MIINIITIDINSVVYLLISSKATGVAKILLMLLHKLGALLMAYSNKNSTLVTFGGGKG